MALSIIAEALARVEHKLDLILTKIAFLDQTPLQQVGSWGNSCPVCKEVVEFKMDLLNGVVVRKCGCKTGILAPLIPLIPPPGAPSNGISATTATPEATDSPDSPRRKGR